MGTIRSQMQASISHIQLAGLHIVVHLLMERFVALGTGDETSFEDLQKIWEPQAK